MKLLSFLNYYIRLRLKVLFGNHPTVNPLGIVWRWKYWRNRKEKSHKRKIGEKL